MKDKSTPQCHAKQITKGDIYQGVAHFNKAWHFNHSARNPAGYSDNN
ncbi:unnamed protein product [marine sediment metagenome]|uniref:Uncharacterized protein n=1 Tax=marine sediment metagenome TaxID=412755 RepID=X1PZZ8_9ZZZZ